MRFAIALAAAFMVATPAAAQQAPQVPKALTDPATAEKLSRMMQVLSKSFLELPIGEVEAAAEGREPTAADRRRTVREAGKEGDPNFEQKLQSQVANSKPMMDAAMKALAAALPAMMDGMSRAGEELQKGPYVAETFPVKIEENYIVIDL